jgi:hypothetical protein
MTDEHHAITLDYEKTVGELREINIQLLADLDMLLDECDRLRVENRNLTLVNKERTDNAVSLLQTIDILRSENERLKIALQTGEQ